MNQDTLTFFLKMQDFASSGISKFHKNAKTTFEKVERYSDKVTKKNDILSTSYNTLRVKIKQLEGTINSSNSVSHIRAARKELTALQKQANKHAGNTGSSNPSRIMGLTRGLLPMLGVAGGMALGREVEKTAMDSGNVARAIDFTTNGQGGKATSQVKSINKTLGMNNAAGLESFQTLSGSYKAPLQDQIGLYEGLSKAARTYNLDSEKVKGAMLALSQMASKGKVSAEELRGQLAERIPGAFSLAADAMGVTEAGLNKMMEKGEVVSDVFLPRFAKALNDKFTAPAMKAAKGPGATMERYRNKLYQVQVAVGQFLIPTLEKLRLFFIDSVDFIQRNSEVFQVLGAVMVGVTVGFVAYHVAMMAGTGIMAIYTGAQTILAIATGKMTIAQWALNAAFTANPIGLAVAGIAALAAGVYYAWNNFVGFRSAIMGIWEAAKQVFTNVGTFFKQIFDPIFKAIDAFKRGDYLEAGKQAAYGLATLHPVALANSAANFAADGGFTKDVSKSYKRGQLWEKIRSREQQKKDVASAAATSTETTTNTLDTTSTLDNVVGDVAKSGPRAININGVKFAENVTISSNTIEEGLDDLEGQLETMFLRLLNSAAAVN